MWGILCKATNCTYDEMRARENRQQVTTSHVPCTVCLGGMYRQHFCSGLSMVMAVNVGDIWAWPRLSCSRLAHFRNLPVGGGIRRPTRVGNFVLPSYWLRREVVGEGALRGRSPRTREGRIGPTAQKRGERNIFRHTESWAPLGKDLAVTTAVK